MNGGIWKKSALCLAIAIVSAAAVSARASEQFYRLHEGITAYVLNPDGKDFSVGLDVRDLNLYANGPREILFKVYDPDGKPVVREVIPDDGCTSANLPDRIGGWDHELQCYINHYAKGTTPSVRWSAWSDPNRLKTIVARAFDRPIKGAKKGTYRIVLAGTPDHYVTLRLSPDLKYAVCGHPTFMHAHGDMLKKAYIYVPQNATGLFFAVAEPDEPRGRHFKLTGPDGKVLFDGMATGGFVCPNDHPALKKGFEAVSASIPQYAGKLLTLDVSDGDNDYLIKSTFIVKLPYDDYVHMGSCAVFAPDAATATAIQGGTVVVDNQTFWHPFQVRGHEWLKKNPLPGNPKLYKELESVFNGFHMLETGDCRGSASWSNLAYAMGYYGMQVFKPGWVLTRRSDVPEDAKALIKEGLIMAGDRLSFATHIEKVNGNAFSQINVALWYSHRATGDALQKERFETFWQRWTTEGWGRGSGLSASGDSQEHFAHDMHYGSYIMDNWKASGNTWVTEDKTKTINSGGGILGDAVDDPRFQKVIDRYQDLYTFLYCREAATKLAVEANPWSARTHMSSHHAAENWESPKHPWKGDPGPDVTADVNGGHEWFAARHKGYYVLTFHGRLAPEWMIETFEGQLGFGGGVLCQVTVPGKGPVITSTLSESYGRGTHPSQWQTFHVHSLVGERWDGAPIVAGISEHTAKLEGNKVTSSGEIRGARLKSTRSFTYNPDSIDCSVELAESDYVEVLSLWSHATTGSEVRVAYEMIPYLMMDPNKKAPTTVKTAEGAALTAAGATTKSVRIDRGGFGVEIQLEKPTPVKLGPTPEKPGSVGTVMIQVVPQGPQPVPANTAKLKYKIVPFGA